MFTLNLHFLLLKEFTKRCGDSDQLMILLDRINTPVVKANLPILEALMKLIPFLASGEQEKMTTLINHFKPYLNFLQYVSCGQGIKLYSGVTLAFDSYTVLYCNVLYCAVLCRAVLHLGQVLRALGEAVIPRGLIRMTHRRVEHALVLDQSLPQPWENGPAALWAGFSVQG